MSSCGSGGRRECCWGEARSARPLVKFISRLLLMRFGSGRLSRGKIKTLRGRQFLRGGLVTGDSSPDIGVLWLQGVVVVGPGSRWSGGSTKGGSRERHLPGVHRPRPVTRPGSRRTAPAESVGFGLQGQTGSASSPIFTSSPCVTWVHSASLSVE